MDPVLVTSGSRSPPKYDVALKDCSLHAYALFKEGHLMAIKALRSRPMLERFQSVSSERGAWGWWLWCVWGPGKLGRQGPAITSGPVCRS